MLLISHNTLNTAKWYTSALFYIRCAFCLIHWSNLLFRTECFTSLYLGYCGLHFHGGHIFTLPSECISRSVLEVKPTKLIHHKNISRSNVLNISTRAAILDFFAKIFLWNLHFHMLHKYSHKSVKVWNPVFGKTFPALMPPNASGDVCILKSMPVMLDKASFESVLKIIAKSKQRELNTWSTYRLYSKHFSWSSYWWRSHRHSRDSL